MDSTEPVDSVDSVSVLPQHNDAPDERYDPSDWDFSDSDGDSAYEESSDFIVPGPEVRSIGTVPARVPAPVIAGALCAILAATNGRPSSELKGLIRQIRASTLVLSELPDDVRSTYQGVLEALEFQVSNLSASAIIDFDDVPPVDNHTDAVRETIGSLATIARDKKAVTNPTVSFQTLAEKIQASHAKRRYLDAVATIDNKATAEEKMTAHKAIIPPTTQLAVVRSGGIVTAAALIDRHLASNASDIGISHSSGFRTLDLAFTAAGEPLHFIAPGEQTVIAGPTGTGKSSMQYTLTRAAAQDELNWGLPDTPVLVAHTEEESVTKAYAMGIHPGQRFHHLADKIVIENIGSSRRRLAELVYDLVMNAVSRSQTTSRPIGDFLPRIGFLDYIQSLSEPGENEVQANITTAELILRGFQSFNPDEMAKFSKVDFRSYSGMAWPEGIEDHRMAWVVFAQLKKPTDENSMFYKSNARKSELSDFTLEDTSATPGWRDPGGNGWAWEVRENDFRIFRQNQIRGSGLILQNATNIILLHRSQPYNNPKLKPGADGRVHLLDSRARLILDKTRNGSEMQFVPMAYDSSPDGFRGQYYDHLGEKGLSMAVNANLDESFRQSGDPLLPIRPKASPLAGVRY